MKLVQQFYGDSIEMVIHRGPLSSLYELKRIAKQHLVVTPPEAVPLLLRARGLTIEQLTISEQHRQVRLLITSRNERDFIGCVRCGCELWDAYRIGERSAVGMIRHDFGLNAILILATHLIVD